MTTCKRAKRDLALLLCFCLLGSLFPAASALGEERLDLPDLSEEHPLFPQWGTVYDLDTGAAAPFHYEVPESGAVVLLFFDSGNEHASAPLLQELNEAAWAGSELVNLIAIDSSKNSPDTLRGFLQSADPAGVVDRAYYNESTNALAFWYLSYIENRGQIGESIGGSITYPYVLIITEEDGQPMIRYALMAQNGTRDMANCLAQLIELEGLEASEDELVRLRVSGAERYDLVQAVYERVNDFRIANELPALRLSAETTALAMQRAAECSVFYSGSHERPNGKVCFSVAEEMPLTDAVLRAENIAAGFESAAEVMNGWINSPGHRSNILLGDITLLGVGCFENNGILYWVQLFATGSDALPLRLTVRSPAIVEVTSLRSRLELSWPDHAPLRLAVGEEARLPSILCVNQGYRHRPMELLPWVTSPLSDEGTPTVSEQLRGDGLYLRGEAPGSGSFAYAAWPGQEDAPLWSVTVAKAPFSLDLTNDGQMDVQDAAALFRLLSEGGELPQRADLDGDGSLTNRDALLFFRRLAQ